MLYGRCIVVLHCILKRIAMQHNTTTYASLHTIIAYMQHARSLTGRADFQFLLHLTLQQCNTCVLKYKILILCNNKRHIAGIVDSFVYVVSNDQKPNWPVTKGRDEFNCQIGSFDNSFDNPSLRPLVLHDCNNDATRNNQVTCIII